MIGNASSVTQMLSKWVMSENNSNWTDAVGVNKCFESVKLSILLHTGASLNELPSNITIMIECV